MNKKIFCFVLFCFILVFSTFSDTDESYDDPENYEDLVPEEYGEDEFHPVLRDIRRAEVILIGSFPFTVLFSSISFELYDYASSGFDSASAPAIFGGTESIRSGDETKRILLTALCISAAITITDFIIGKVKAKKAKKANEKNHKNNSRESTAKSPS